MKFKETIAKLLIALTIFVPSSEVLLSCTPVKPEPKPTPDITDDSNKDDDKQNGNQGDDNQNEENQKDDNQNDDNKPNDNKDEDNNDQESDELFKEKKDKIVKFFNNLGANFEYKMYNDEEMQDLVRTALFNRTFVKMTQNGSNFDDLRYFSKENGVDYTYYKDESGKIHKSIVENPKTGMTFDKALIVVEQFKTASWESYDKDTELLTGKVEIGNSDEQKFEAKILNDSVIIYFNGQTCVIDNVNKVSERLPEEYIDDTFKQEEYVYTTQNGKRIYNRPLLAKALEESLDDEIMTKLNYNIKTTLKKVLYINSSENSLSFGSEFEIQPNYKYLGIFNFDLSKLDDSSMKFDDFCSLLKQDSSILTLTEKKYAYKDSTLENEHIRELAENVIRKYAKSGIQDYYKQNLQDNPEPEYENAKVIYAGKSEDKGPLSGNGLGFKSSSTYIMIFERNGMLEQAIFDVTVKSYGKDFEYYLLQENQEFVLITSANITDLDYSNLQLYENEQK